MTKPIKTNNNLESIDILGYGFVLSIQNFMSCGELKPSPSSSVLEDGRGRKRAEEHNKGSNTV